MIESETWTWERVGSHEGPVFLGAWQALAYIAERPDGWYAAGEGHQTGPEFVYRLPGRAVPSGPYSHAGAERLAWQMIGLAPDASCPRPDELVLYQPAGVPGLREPTAHDVTGRRWSFASAGAAHACVLCNAMITSGWTEGPWNQARQFVCGAHVQVCAEPRPGHSLHRGVAPAPNRGRGAESL